MVGNLYSSNTRKPKGLWNSCEKVVVHVNQSKTWIVPDIHLICVYYIRKNDDSNNDAEQYTNEPKNQTVEQLTQY